MAEPSRQFQELTYPSEGLKVKAYLYRPLLMHAQNDRMVPVDFSRMVYEEVRQRGVTASLKEYPPFKVAGKEFEGHALFDRVDGLPAFWTDLTNFLAETLKR